MVQRFRGRGDTIPRAPELLEAMGQSRDRLLEAGNGVRPFGTAYHAIHLVTTAIETLAFFITGPAALLFDRRLGAGRRADAAGAAAR